MARVGRPSLSLIHTGFLLAVVLLPGVRIYWVLTITDIPAYICKHSITNLATRN